MKTKVSALILFVLSGAVHATAMQELNLQRKNLGLPPLREDPRLTAHAQRRAEYQATHRLSLYNGYSPSQVHRGDSGISGGPIVEGCGAMPRNTPQDCWCTCAMRVLGDPMVGAGVAWGSDGVRYMCLIVRARDIRTGGLRKPMIATAHLTPDAPRMPRRSEPVVIASTPVNSKFGDW